MEDDVQLIQKSTETRLVRLECRLAEFATDMGKATSNAGDLRGRMDDGLRTMRQEMRDGDRAVREAGEKRFLALYEQVSDRERALREEMSEGLWSMRKELWKKESRNTNILALAYLVVLLGMAAKGFHWI
jgi:hypothetical protein